MNPLGYDDIWNTITYVVHDTLQGICAGDEPGFITTKNQLNTSARVLSMEEVYKEYLERKSITYYWDNSDDAKAHQEAVAKVLDQLSGSHPELFI